MTNQKGAAGGPGAARMRQLAREIDKLLGNGPHTNRLGFALLVFKFNEPGMSNYISNARREDMILALEEAVKRLNGQQDFPTPEEN